MEILIITVYMSLAILTYLAFYRLLRFKDDEIHVFMIASALFPIAWIAYIIATITIGTKFLMEVGNDNKSKKK